MSEGGRQPGSPPRANRLATQQSPYLLQHAHNPVDWYPWGDDAFERAAAEDKPIFLSIGYATCHWCHVMERESFEDPEIAALLSDSFISVKVDREERPDIDGVYMTVCQLMTGHGGWPLTVVMTPSKKPFFAGTYFPPESRYGRVGMRELLPRLAALWRERRDDLEASGEAALAAVRESEALPRGSGGGEPGPTTLRRGYDELATRFDAHQGGFGRAPKFPTPHQLLFLLRWHARAGDAHALEMVERTLTMMRRGGIFDHVGYGFHRYSTDPRWLVPHFEKMLYDQALLVMAYAETWQVTGNHRYRRVVDEILEYVLRDLTDPEGAFYSAEDADSEGREGAFYLWRREAFDAVVTGALGDDAAALGRRAFNVEGRGNFADEATGERTGENILHRREPLPDLAAALDRPAEQLATELEAIRLALLEARTRRERPLLDDKILTDWNGLMIAALALAGRALRTPTYAEAAARAARFILERMRDADGRLMHRYRGGDAAIPAGAADHAFLAWGLTELYAATLDVAWLEEAVRQIDELLAGFWDESGAGLFTVAHDVTDVPVRQKERYDGAIPSANAVAWYVLGRVGRLTGDARLLARADALGRSFASAVEAAPSAHAMWLVGLDLHLGPGHEVVIVGRPGAADTEGLLEALARAYRPRTAVLLKPLEAEARARLERLAPFTAAHAPLDGRAAAYVCSGFTCQRPTSDTSEMLALLD